VEKHSYTRRGFARKKWRCYVQLVPEATRNAKRIKNPWYSHITRVTRVIQVRDEDKNDKSKSAIRRKRTTTTRRTKSRIIRRKSCISRKRKEGDKVHHGDTRSPSSSEGRIPSQVQDRIVIQVVEDKTNIRGKSIPSRGKGNRIESREDSSPTRSRKQPQQYRKRLQQ